MSLIKIKNVTKQYVLGDTILNALDNVSVNIEKGEFVAIVGQSGSGKSTLMNILGCLDTPQKGSYYLNGNDIFNAKESKLSQIRNKEIGFIFQSFQLLKRNTVLENVMLPLMYFLEKPVFVAISPIVFPWQMTFPSMSL